jgi:hypothetical protein
MANTEELRERRPERPVELADHHLRLGAQVVDVAFHQRLARPQDDAVRHRDCLRIG